MNAPLLTYYIPCPTPRLHKHIFLFPLFYPRVQQSAFELRRQLACWWRVRFVLVSHFPFSRVAKEYTLQES